jgi:crotonobetainyl-CoA:carnitine CoA-transferase CaiB-like acyl-CoA transferase
LCVLDFTTLLPGPMATLLLAEAGAEVIKVEPPGRGDAMRGYAPHFGRNSVNFALLNRGKRSIALDLKKPGAVQRLTPLIEKAQVLIEQFRPGVMARLGLGFEAVREINPTLIYCSITGYGQSGPNAQVAAHDLNYIAEAGLLSLSADASGAPAVPPALIADIGGGTLPAVINILLALRRAEATGKGCHLDIAMYDNLFAWQYWALGKWEATGQAPKPGGELLSGGSPRYHIYQTADGRHLAAAPLEQKFWERFCELIELPEGLRDNAADPQATVRAVATIIGGREAAHWASRFAGEDVCCNLVRTLEEALQSPHFAARGLFAARLATTGESNERGLPALPVPLAPALRAAPDSRGYPALGEANGMLEPEKPEKKE